MRLYYPLAIVLGVLVCSESLCMGNWLQGNHRELVSIVHLICGLLIGGILLFKIERPTVPANGGWQRHLPTAALAIFAVWLVQRTVTKSEGILAQTPVDYHISDVLPIMQIMSQRWMSGQQVYAIIPEIWGGMKPIYLPAMWMPYVISETWHFDPRWIDIVWMLVAGLLPLLWPRAGRQAVWLTLLAALATHLLFQQFLRMDTRLVSMSDEGVVVGWYTLLAWALWRNNPWLIGVALTLSVLSRLSLAGWIPAYGLYVLLSEGRTRTLKIFGTAAVLGLALMVGSQAIFHLDNFLELPRRYLEAVQGEEYQKLTGAINEGLGIAKFLTQQQLVQLHYLNQFATFGIPLLLVGLWWRFRSRFDPVFFPLALLKIALVVFFNLLIIPIHTMFYTSCFVSVAALAFYTMAPRSEASTTA